MASPEDLNVLDKLETANYATLTEAEKDTFRSVDFSDGTLAEAAGKMNINVNGRDMTVDDLGKEIYERAKDITFTTHAEVKKFLTDNGFGGIDRTPITGKLQGATAAGIDFRFGIGTMTALKAKYSKINEPITVPPEAKDPVIEEQQYGPVIDIKSIAFDTIKQIIVDTNLRRPNIANCDSCVNQGIKEGYVDSNGYLKRDSISYSHQDSTISIRGAGLTIDVHDLFKRDKNGDGRYFDSTEFTKRLVTKTQEKNNRKLEEKRTESMETAVSLRNSYKGIIEKYNVFKQTAQNNINEEKTITTIQSSDTKITEYINTIIGQKNTAKTTYLSSLNNLLQKANDIGVDVYNVKSDLIKDITAQQKVINEDIKNLNTLQAFFEGYRKDKKALYNYTDKFNTPEKIGQTSLAELQKAIAEGSTLRQNLFNTSKNLTEYDAMWGGPDKNYGRKAYEGGIKIIDNTISTIRKSTAKVA